LLKELKKIDKIKDCPALFYRKKVKIKTRLNYSTLLCWMYFANNPAGVNISHGDYRLYSHERK